MATATIERIVYEVDNAAGASGTVLCIHGLGGNSNTWTAIMPALQRYQVIRIDLPGSGRSAGIEGELSIERFVKACLRVLAACRVERVQVLAHSLGTIVAGHLAAAEPARVASLAMFGPLLAPPDAARPGLRARAARLRVEGVAGMQALADTLVQAATSSETRATRLAAVAFVRESLMRQDPDGYARTADALAESQAADAVRITCPTLLVTGDQDAVAPPQAVRHMGEKIVGAQVEVLTGCGHWTPIERPDACIELLRRFQSRRLS
jgi:3-oxoadipate enol-lactonase